jgi:hypothetical protein
VTRPTILEALADRNLLGAFPRFRDLTSREPWLTFAAAAYGLPLDASGVALFCKATGRSRYDPPPGGWAEVACAVGRQAGKTEQAAGIVAYEAAFHPEVPDGELYALLLAQDQRAAVRTAFSNIAAMFDASPLFRRLVVHRTADTLRLENGLVMTAYPCRPAAVRGLRAIVAVADELAFYRGSDMRPLDVEMLRALRPTLATTGGRLVILSSPHGRQGALWDLFRRHHGRDDAPVLTWQASAPEMNPTLPPRYLERMREDDPEAYKREVLGEFTNDLSSLFDADALDACIARGRRELPPVAGLRYHAFCDASGGRRDAYAVAIGHRHGTRAVVDVVRAWAAPFNPSGVTEECAALLRQYRVSRVEGDRFGGEWPREAFRAHGITYATAEKDKSALYLEMLSAVNSGAVELPDDPELLRELRGLERRRARAGRDRVDHPVGGHDDRANAAAGLLSAVLDKRAAADRFGPVDLRAILGNDRDPWEQRWIRWEREQDRREGRG